MTRPTRLLVVTGLAVGLALAGCGDDDDGGSAAPEGRPDAPDITVVSDGLEFVPAELEAPLGPVDLFHDHQSGSLVHNVHVTGSGIDEKTELVTGPEIQLLELDFTQPGTYDFICDVHPNMRGTIEVQAAG